MSRYITSVMFVLSCRFMHMSNWNSLQESCHQMSVKKQLRSVDNCT